MKKIKQKIFSAYLWLRGLTAKHRKLPDFIIIGAQKAGTTFLYSCLNQHPDIKMSTVKEVHYFDLNYEKDINWYKKFFPLKINKNKTGEASPYYMFHPYVPGRIAKKIADVKLIVLLRHPVYRAYSHFQWERKKNREKEAHFIDAIRLETSRLKNEHFLLLKNPGYKSYSHRHFSYLSRSKYFEQLNRWLKYFDKKQLLIIKSEDLFNNPEKELKKVYNFIHVKTWFSDKMKPQNVNQYNNNLSAKDIEVVKEKLSEDIKKLNEVFAIDFN